MNSMAEKVEKRIAEIRKQYRELKRRGNVDPSVLKEKIISFINVAKSKDESLEDMRKEAEDVLIDVRFIIEEGCCSPLKARSIR